MKEIITIKMEWRDIQKHIGDLIVPIILLIYILVIGFIYVPWVTASILGAIAIIIGTVYLIYQKKKQFKGDYY